MAKTAVVARPQLATTASSDGALPEASILPPGRTEVANFAAFDHLVADDEAAGLLKFAARKPPTDAAACTTPLSRRGLILSLPAPPVD